MSVTTGKRALVLSGGGFGGAAWMLGLIDALREGGVDLGDADLIVGTSAGARSGAQPATGVLDEAVEMNRRGTAPQAQGAATLGEFLAASMGIIGQVGDGQEAARRIANLESKLDAELATLGEATVHVIVADEASLAAIGPNPLTTDTGRAVAAGAAQAKREIDSLRTWSQ
jgi:predicted acylesterase/phospholipase RssA